MKNGILLAVRAASFVVGYFGSLSLIRALSGAFHWYIYRVYGNWFNFGFIISLFLLTISIAAFSLSIFFAKPTRFRSPLCRADFMTITLVCGVGFYLCFATLIQMRLQFYLQILPIVAYLCAMTFVGETSARIRDRAFLSTLYWPKFFSTFPANRLVGFTALSLLVSQMALLILFAFIPIQLTAMFVICALTYLAAFLLGLSNEYSTKYERVNAEKVRAEQFKSELITNVSHDIRTPLTSIINYVNLLEKEAPQGQSAEYVQILARKSMRLKSLIDDLMEASKAGTGNVRVESQPINLGEIIGQAAGESDDRFNETNLTLVFRQPDTPTIIHSDSRHLYRVLENLFSNVAKYALSGTRVFAEIINTGDLVQFVLQNTAREPIDLTDDELTEQFIRGDKARQTEGSGLGLYIAKSLVELMGGTFKISVIGDLFRVVITLGLSELD